MARVRKRQKGKGVDDDDGDQEYIPSTKRKLNFSPSETTSKRQQPLRRVQFDGKSPDIFEITPLNDKPLGIVRMPPDMKNYAPKPEDLDSPPHKQNEVLPPFLVNFMESHRMDNDELAIFTRGRHVAKHNKFWYQRFAPHTAADFFGKSAYDYKELTGWFGQWASKLKNDKKKEERKRAKEQQQNRKRRRSQKFFEDERDEDDDEADEEDFQLDDQQQPMGNPIILEGPTGCGKTTMVYAAAKENNFEVIEISAFVLRDSPSLNAKLAGALESQNVNQNSGQPDIRTMFSPKSEQRQQKENGICTKPERAEFSAILVDECDLVYAADQHFWPTLKKICDESRIPIVFTCIDYGLVNEEMNREPAMLNYKTIHMEMPSSERLAHYLQFWLMGFTGKYQKTTLLCDLIEEKGGDPRSVLNSLQLDNGTIEFRGKGNLAKESDEQRIETNLKEMSKQAKMRAAMDATFYPVDPRISFMVKRRADLDFKGGDVIKNADDLDAEMEERREIRDTFFGALYMDSEFNDANRHSIFHQFGESPPKMVVRHACYRNLDKGRLYSMRDNLYSLPCLLEIHRNWMRQTFDLGRKLRQAPHPFHQVNSGNGSVLDDSHQLKNIISSFAFPEPIFSPSANAKM